MIKDRQYDLKFLNFIYKNRPWIFVGAFCIFISFIMLIMETIYA